MSNFDKDMQKALEEENGFDPTRTGAAQHEVYQTYNKKLKLSERAMWLMVYLLLAVCVYTIQGYILFATSTKEWIAYGLAFMLAFVILIQKTVLFGVSATYLVLMKEIKQLQLAVVGGSTEGNRGTIKPINGLARWEKLLWFCGLMVVSWGGSTLGMRTNAQDDVWILKPAGQVEAHCTLTLRRFPHRIWTLYNLTAPASGAVLQSASFNGQSAPIVSYAKDKYTVQLPGEVSWGEDKVEMVWTFPLAAVTNGVDVQAPLRSAVPVHRYTLTLELEDDCGYEASSERSWKFMKTPEELKDEVQARRTLKCFSRHIRGDMPITDFGTCGPGIKALPNS